MNQTFKDFVRAYQTDFCREVLSALDIERLRREYESYGAKQG